MAKRYIKLFEALEVNYDGEIIRVNSFPELWDMFHWDIKNDESANNAALEVTRMIVATGYIDMTAAMPEGHTLTVSVIPVKD